MSDLKQTIGATLVACGVFLAMFLGLKWELIPSAVFGVSTYAGVYLLTKPRRRIGGKETPPKEFRRAAVFLMVH